LLADGLHRAQRVSLVARCVSATVKTLAVGVVWTLVFLGITIGYALVVSWFSCPAP
jgi:hypothetical protein